MPDLDPDAVYERCPMCEDCDREDCCGDCAWCDGTGLVPHDCPEDDA